jgi:hypothetical protein
MRLVNYLTELLKTDIDLKVIKKGSDKFEAGFNVDDKKFVFKGELELKPSHWQVDFVRITDKGTSIELMKDLGLKGALKVFSAVSSALQEFIKNYKPDIFYFTAKEPSRVKLYRMMSKKISKMPGYTFTGEFWDEGDNFMEFEFKKG